MPEVKDNEKVTFTPLSDDEVNKYFAEHKSERTELQATQGVINPMEFARVLGVRPQMIYNYIRSGKIKSVAENNTQKKVIKLTEAKRYAAEYLGRKSAKNEKVQAELDAS